MRSTAVSRYFGLSAVAWLSLILLLAVALRLPGLFWGLPDAAHPDYSWHPDEALPILWARWLTQGRIIAKHFMYGGTLHYSMLNAYFDYGRLLAPWFGDNTLANTLRVGRGFTVALSLLTVLLTYQTGKRLFGPGTGLLAAALLALSPVHVFLAQNVRPDEAATFLSLLMLYLSSFILHASAERELRLFALAGLLCGASIALRFPLAVFGLAPPLAYLLRESASVPGPALVLPLCRRLLLMFGCLLLGYAAASPHSLRYLPALVSGLLVQQRYQTSSFPDAIDRGPAIVQYGWLTLREALGLPLYLLALAGVAASVLRPARPRLLLLIPTLAYFVLLLFVSWVVVRYTMPLVPLLALLSACLLSAVTRLRSLQRRLAIVAVGVAMALTLVGDIAFLRVQVGRNTRDLASDWIAVHTAAGAAVVEIQMYTGDVYLNPALPADRLQTTLVLNQDFDPARLVQGSGHDYLVLNQELYGNMERLQPAQLSAPTAALRQLIHGGAYRLEAEIVQPVRFLGLDFSACFTSQDFRIINPGERIYRFVPPSATAASS